MPKVASLWFFIYIYIYIYIYIIALTDFVNTDFLYRVKTQYNKLIRDKALL